MQRFSKRKQLPPEEEEEVADLNLVGGGSDTCTNGSAASCEKAQGAEGKEENGAAALEINHHM